MSIISGKLKSFRFNPPKGFPSRPTTDFAKEGLFNMLVNQFSLIDLEILDLYTGTGNISFEFASREAGNIISVDKNFKCIRFIKEFSKKHGIDDCLKAFKEDAFRFLNSNTKQFDLIFADPPFDDDIHEKLLAAVFESEAVTNDGVFILEHNKHIDVSNSKYFESSRKYGHVVFSFFSKNH